MSQWGSKYLGDQGYTAIEIIRNYYGDDMYINEAEQISGIPSSWPGYDLSNGSTGDKVRMIQEQLNRIAKNYPSIPTIAVDGIYGNATQAAVRQFQSIFNLPATGIVDYPTWYKISQIYVGVSKIAELTWYKNQGDNNNFYLPGNYSSNNTLSCHRTFPQIPVLITHILQKLPQRGW